MTIEIIPAGSSAVVTDRHDHGNRDRDRNYRDNHDVELMHAIKEAEADLERSAGRHFAGTLENIKDAEAQLERSFGDKFGNVSRDVKDAEGRVTRDVKDSEVRVTRDVKDAQYDGVLATKDARHDGIIATTTAGSAGVLATKESRFDVMQGLSSGFTAQAKANCHSDEENKKDFFFTQKQISDSAYATQGGFKDLTSLNYQIEGRALLEAAKNAAALAVQADKNWAATNLQAQVNHAASTLLATQIAAQSAKEAAECCCELKEKIGEDGQKTRDLINSIQMQDLRDRATKSENALASYFAAKVCPVVP
jgi:hypothetical protein